MQAVINCFMVHAASELLTLVQRTQMTSQPSPSAPPELPNLWRYAPLLTASWPMGCSVSWRLESTQESRGPRGVGASWPQPHLPSHPHLHGHLQPASLPPAACSLQAGGVPTPAAYHSPPRPRLSRLVTMMESARRSMRMKIALPRCLCLRNPSQLFVLLFFAGFAPLCQPRLMPIWAVML